MGTMKPFHVRLFTIHENTNLSNLNKPHRCLTTQDMQFVIPHKKNLVHFSISVIKPQKQKETQAVSPSIDSC